MRTTQLLFRFILVLALPATACHAQFHVDLHAETLHVDNVSRAAQGPDIREDTVATAALRSSLHLQPGIFTGLDLRAGLERSLHRRYSGLNLLEASVALALTHKFGIGDRAPVMGLDIALGRREYSTDLRDAWFYRAGLNGRKRINDSFSLALQLGYEKQDGDHNQPRPPMMAAPGMPAALPKPGNPWSFDLLYASLQAEYELSALSWLSAGYRFQHGDIVSSSRSYPAAAAGATATTNDPVFGPGVIAYRLPANTHSYTLDYNRAVLDAATLYAGFEEQDTRGINGIDYRTSLFRAGFIYAF